VGLCVRRLAVLACLLAPAGLHAQLAPVGVPAGVLRVDLDGALETWDHRWLDGSREPLGADLSSPAAGSDLFPSLADADARIGRITGLPDLRLNLGALTTDAEADVGRGTLGLALGLTRSLTVFGRIPLVRARVQSAIQLDPAAANAGANPGAEQEAGFFQELDASLASLGGRIAAGEFDANPALKAQAQATLDAGTSLRADLFGLLADPATASPFVPTATSPAGAAIAARVSGLQATLANDFGVAGFTSGVALADSPLSRDELVGFISDPSGPIAERTGESKVTFRGDAETGLALTLADHWDRGTHRGGFRAALEGLVRFPTGQVARSDRLLALGTGEGQTDIELRLTTDLGSGSWGARAEALYSRQLAGDFLVRMAPPTQPLAGIDLLTVVHRDPGDIVSLAVRPFFRLAPTLAIQGSARHWSRGADEVAYATALDSVPGVPASVAAEDTKASATVLGIGLTYSSPGRLRPGGTGLPVDASWTYERVVGASGGIVPDRQAVRAQLRLYFGIFQPGTASGPRN
jgi:hypothetical protein